ERAVDEVRVRRVVLAAPEVEGDAGRKAARELEALAREDELPDAEVEGEVAGLVAIGQFEVRVLGPVEVDVVGAAALLDLDLVDVQVTLAGQLEVRALGDLLAALDRDRSDGELPPAPGAAQLRWPGVGAGAGGEQHARQARDDRDASRSSDRRHGAQYTITDRATSPFSIASNAPLTSSSLIRRETSSSILSLPRMYRSISLGMSRRMLAQPYSEPTRDFSSSGSMMPGTETSRPKPGTPTTITLPPPSPHTKPS